MGLKIKAVITQSTEECYINDVLQTNIHRIKVIHVTGHKPMVTITLEPDVLEVEAEPD